MADQSSNKGTGAAGLPTTIHPAARWILCDGHGEVPSVSWAVLLIKTEKFLLHNQKKKHHQYAFHSRLIDFAIIYVTRAVKKTPIWETEKTVFLSPFFPPGKSQMRKTKKKHLKHQNSVQDRPPPAAGAPWLMCLCNSLIKRRKRRCRLRLSQRERNLPRPTVTEQNIISSTSLPLITCMR